MHLIWLLIIGGLAGWIAGLMMKGRGFGIGGNIVVGVVGALIGGFLFRVLGIHAAGMAGSLVTAVIGALLLLALAGWLKKA